MARAAILLAFLALFLVTLNVLVGSLTGLGLASVRAHATLAIPSSVAALFAWSVVVLYFVGACAWVREAVEERRLERALAEEARRIRRLVLPWVLAAVAALVLAYVLGGGADTGAVPPSVHLGLAVAALALHVVTAYRTVIFVGMVLDLEERVEGGSA
jgi:H+/Cl- antiporter ClcA